MNEEKTPFDAKEKPKKGIKRFAKKLTAIGAAGAVVLSLLIPAGLDALEPKDAIDESLLNPTPVVMMIDEAEPEDDAGEKEDEKEKMGLLKRLKLAIYGFFGAIGLWIATKIPWRKIFNRRNLYIALALALLFLVGYYGLPLVWDACPWGGRPQ